MVWVTTVGSSPEQTLNIILEIEKKLGRIREDASGYQDRVIDIDLLFFDDQQINSKTLSLPHPQICNRKFVLVPFNDIQPKFIHPVLNKEIHQLLAETTDSSELQKISKWLKNPKSTYTLRPFKYLVIEGNIGAGKTSLAHLLSQENEVNLILERFKDNPFLAKFYKDPKRYAFSLEMSFLVDRYQQLLEDITQLNLFSDGIIADYDLYKSLIFSKINLSQEEYNLYKKIFQVMYKEIPQPDLLVFLYQTPDTLLQNIKKRGRAYEQEIEKEYLIKIEKGYQDHLKTRGDGPLKIIDTTHLDFVNNRKDFLKVVRQIID